EERAQRAAGELLPHGLRREDDEEGEADAGEDARDEAHRVLAQGRQEPGRAAARRGGRHEHAGEGEDDEDEVAHEDRREDERRGLAARLGGLRPEEGREAGVRHPSPSVISRKRSSRPPLSRARALTARPASTRRRFTAAAASGAASTTRRPSDSRAPRTPGASRSAARARGMSSTSTTRRSPLERSDAMGPSATTRPLRRIAACVHVSCTSWRRWLETSTERPAAAKSRSRRRTSSCPAGSRPLV